MSDLPLDAWNRVVDHIKACWPHSRPWSVETQQAFYDVLRHYSYEELIGAVSDLAKSPRRFSREWRERPSLAELREAAASARAALERIRESVKTAIAQDPRKGWFHRGMPMEPPGDSAGPYVRLGWAITQGEIEIGDSAAQERFLREHGARLEAPPPTGTIGQLRDRRWSS